MSTTQQMRKEIHNLHQRKSRLLRKAKDPLFMQKNRERAKKYYDAMPPEKKQKVLARHCAYNKTHREQINKSQRKHYQKNRLTILAKKKLQLSRCSISRPKAQTQRGNN